MRIVMVGSMDETLLDELRDKPVVVLTGSIDEVRAAGALLYQDVSVAVGVPISGPVTSYRSSDGGDSWERGAPPCASTGNDGGKT